MINDSTYQRSLEVLKAAMVKGPSYDDYNTTIGFRDEVHQRFGRVFSRAHVRTIREDEFRAFLDFKNNHHWSGLHRQGPRM